MRGVSVPKTGPKSVATPRERPQMVLGSRPQSMYAPRIKPAAASQREYSKPQKEPTPVPGFSSLLGDTNGTS